jgi:outer membrane lipoprotein-sorting protein
MNYFLIILFLSSLIAAQDNDPNDILTEVKNKFEKVDDYEVKIKIVVDMEFLRIPNVSAKVYFKKPNKMKMESDDFAVLPKEGINFSPAELLNNDFSSIYVKSDTLNKSYVDVIKIIPLSDTSNIIISTLWIDKSHKVIRKVESTTKNRGTFSVNLFYDELISYALPSEMIFSFNVETPKMPETLEMEAGSIKKPLGKISKNLTGSIHVHYSDYKLNIGLDDSFFEEDQKK